MCKKNKGATTDNKTVVDVLNAYANNDFNPVEQYSTSKAYITRLPFAWLGFAFDFDFFHLNFSTA